jgi:hypothetical protein
VSPPHEPHQPDTHDQPDRVAENWWEEPVELDTSVPHMARVYDYLLGGSAHFAVDRALAQHATAALPGGIEGARANVRANRAFLAWAVHHLAGDCGIRQFLDIGTGIPNDDNVHMVARQVAPDSRVVYVDHDPVVLAHAHLLMRGVPEGSSAYLDADLRDPDGIVAQAADTLDFRRPVAIMLLGILHYLLDDEDPYGIVARLLAKVTSGSYLVVSHMASDIDPEAMAELTRRHNESAPADLAVVRSHAEVTRFFDGLEVLGPGVVTLDRWHQPDRPTERRIPIYGGIGRVP